MARLSDFVLKSQELTRQQFATEFRHPFLCVRTDEQGSAGRWSFKTETVSTLSPEMLAKLDERGLSLSPKLTRYEVFEVQKVEGNPWPDRISVGRARNSDIVLMHSSVSKLHAHFVVDEEGDLALVDAGSRNGTLLGKDRLSVGEPTKVNSGQKLTFGAITMTFLSAGELYDLIHRSLRPQGARR